MACKLLITLGMMSRIDNLEWEIAAPQRLGIYAIWYDGYSAGLPPGCQVRPDRIIRSLPELLL